LIFRNHFLERFSIFTN